MIQAQIVQNHGIPVVVLQLSRDVSSDVVVHFGKILLPLSKGSSTALAQASPYRNEEACGSVRPVKGVGKELQPCIVTVHNQFPRPFGLHLCEPAVLRGKARRLVCLVYVEYSIEEGRDRAGSYGFQSGHRYGGRRGMRREGEGSSIANQPGPGISMERSVARTCEKAYD